MQLEYLSPSEKLNLLKDELIELLSIAIPNFPMLKLDPDSFPATRALLEKIMKDKRL